MFIFPEHIIVKCLRKMKKTYRYETVKEFVYIGFVVANTDSLPSDF